MTAAASNFKLRAVAIGLTLADLGWDDAWAASAAAIAADGVVARVAVVYQDRVAVVGEGLEGWAELRGRLRERARGEPLQAPAVGDWVVLTPAQGGGMASVEAILPRRGHLVRQAAGRRTTPQIVAANLDAIFVVTSPNRDFSPRRIERYLAAIREGGASPRVILNKVDLCGDVDPWLADLRAVAGDAPVLATSASEGRGLEGLRSALGRGRTIAFVGSSGVGKSSLVNLLLGRARQSVAAIREDDDKGRHTTTHRELMPIDEGAGGLLIDTPGMRSSSPGARPRRSARPSRISPSSPAAAASPTVATAVSPGAPSSRRSTRGASTPVDSGPINA
ncbi:MAG: ribosome small subunit-dependent GTPase A [Nannocystaceae bacterium]